MSRESARPKNVRFVDVDECREAPSPPAWLAASSEEPDWTSYSVHPLMPPEVPSHARPPHAPLLESVRPDAGAPSQFPGASLRAGSTGGFASQVPPPPRLPSIVPGYPTPSQPPGARSPSVLPGPDDVVPEVALPARERRRDTLIEDLVPRAEEEAVLAIQAAVERLQSERAQLLAGAERDLVELVRVICRRVVLREVSLSPTVVEALVHEGLAALGGGDRLTVRLGPFFAGALDHIRDNLQHQGVACSVVIDPAVGPHGCSIETELGRVDESVETRLDVLLANLETAL